MPSTYREHMRTEGNFHLHELQDISVDSCVNLKVIAILMGLKKRCTEFCCRICEWDSRVKSVHYNMKNSPLRKSHTPGTNNVAHQPPVDPCKVVLPPLHIKLGIKKNSLKTLDRNCPEFSFLCEKFPRLSTEKIQAGVFIDLQICWMFRGLQCRSQ
jgi:hypothetical protein